MMNELMVVAMLLATAQVVTQPKPVEVIEPVYPEAARAYLIDGMAGFRATVSAEGTVTSVSVLSVPRSNLGFEAAVEQAVRKWRFTPATLDGKPVIGSYAGQIRFVLPSTISGEVMFSRRSREVWTAVDKLMRQLGFRAEKRDDALQLPGRAALDQKEAVAVVEANLTEHGTIVRPSPREGSGDFQIAAQQAVLLWRFYSGTVRWVSGSRKLHLPRAVQTA